MIRPVLIVLSIAVALVAGGNLRYLLAGDSERITFTETCAYYHKRAGSVRHAGSGDFVVFLARTCAAAENSLDSGTPLQRESAVLLLSRIALLRSTVDEMNGARAARAMARSDGTLPKGVTYISPVTPSGEFLIAHRMGLMLAFDAWLDSGVEFSLASYP